MISNKAIRYVQLRIYSFNFIGATCMSFDKNTGKIVPPNPYLYFNMIFGAWGGWVFTFFHIVQMYLKMNPISIPETEGAKQSLDTEKDQMYTFATTVIACGEILIGASIAGISTVAFIEQHNIINLYNEIFEYNQIILEFMKIRNIEFDREHKQNQKALENVVLGTNFGSMIIGFLLSLTCLHPLEPTHVLVKEWFEIELKLEPSLIPWMLMFTVAIQACANLVITFGLLIMIYCSIATGMMNDLTVERVHSRQGVRSKLETRYFRVLEDQEICVLYRTQRYLNERINEVMGSVLISIHQVGMLAAFSIMLFFFVKFQNVIWEVGPIACAVIVGSLVTPLAISWLQSQFFGTLVDLSDEFGEKARKFVQRRTMFRRFAYTCQTYYVEEAYPYFHFDKNTFLQFCVAGLDHAITLMLW